MDLDDPAVLQNLIGDVSAQIEMMHVDPMVREAYELKKAKLKAMISKIERLAEDTEAARKEYTELKKDWKTAMDSIINNVDKFFGNEYVCMLDSATIL